MSLRPHSPSAPSTVSTLPPNSDNARTPLSPTIPRKSPLTTALHWLRGPTPAVDTTFTPLFPHLQSLPHRLLNRTLKHKRYRLAALCTYYFFWLLSFSTITHTSHFRSRVGGTTPRVLSCAASMWAKNSGCGLDGAACEPFTDSMLPFRCPAQCAGTQVLNPWTVGNLSIVYQPYVIGGPEPGQRPVYRADSFICSAAIHSGVVSDRYGGCGVLTMAGSRPGFAASLRNGIASIPFPASFPSSFEFAEVKAEYCSDLRWTLLGVSVAFTALLSLFTTSSSVLVASTFAGIFFHVSLASNPPVSANPYALVSLAVSRFLPAAFIAYVLHVHVISHTLTLPPGAAVEKTVLWVGALWVGALTNITLEPHIPINRLTSRDLVQQPGAITALVALVLALTAIILFQAHFFRLERRLPRFMALYALFGLGLGLFAAIPGAKLRIHHYILALLLLPGTKLRTRFSLLASGLLLGLFINGVARWGFAGLIETPESLRGDGLFFSSVPRIERVAPRGAEVELTWSLGGPQQGWERGVSVLLNDVERFRVEGLSGGVQWNRTALGAAWETVFVRLGWYGISGVGDYTRAGVLQGDGTWVPPVAGRSR